MQGDAEKLALRQLTREAMLAIDTDLNRSQAKGRGGAGDKTVEIGRPDGANKIGLRKVTEKLIADVRASFANLVLKIAAPVIYDWEALFNEKTIFVMCAIRRKAVLPVEPLLNSAPDSGQ